MIRVKTLTVQLIDAQPDRIRICRIDGESLVTVVIPREDLAEAKSLPNIPQRGVYYLLDENHGNVSRVYAGRYDKAIGHFTVLAGSKVNLSRPVLKNAAVAAARREIFGDSGGIAELAEDLEFPTPSAAAVFVLGGSQNGWTEWVSDDGETLNQVYRSEEN